ncbi:Ribosomal protein S18 acetylase RimI [Reichenbachiella faecimaris]|uniref:Ribosomal protein S18 acetylase RimI n=1 Tax=Reichenbachiella faecimaris TaxID=692418 RepID=A0A1W2GIU2_REIFA|nr:GNAT family N-acetyltransferase [Reichenbachiella faecimaris]SMD36392.1 Ribosomal protein S18 acetylase RimI [Reichenbachiella faecimaris]
MNVRRAQAAEAQHIVDFQIDMARETEDVTLDRNIITPGVQAVFDDESKGWYFVAEVDGKIAGSLMITFEWSDWRNSMILWIQSVFVAKEFRGRGVYKALYKHIQQIVSESNDYAGIRLYVDKTNTNALQVYEKLGMDSQHYGMCEWIKP